MRITFVLPEANLSGGVRVVALHAEQLERRGHRVVVVSVPPHAPGMVERAKSFVRTGRWEEAPVRTSHLDGAAIEHRILDSRRPVTEADLPDADVIVATWWETAEWVSGVSARKGARVYFIQGNEVDFFAEDDHESRQRIQRTMRLPMHRLAVSGWVAERCRALGVADVTVVPNGVDTGRFSTPSRGKRARPTVGFIYARPHLKGVDIAAEAVRLARREEPGLRVVAFGSERLGGRPRLPGGRRFVCRPEQGRIPGLYASADAWLFPSRSEGFGLPVLEAMACGTPVIASPVGIAPEALSAGGGILLPKGDAGEMAAAIVRVAWMEDAAWREMSAGARRAAGRFTWEESFNLFEAELVRAQEAARPRAVAV